MTRLLFCLALALSSASALDVNPPLSKKAENFDVAGHKAFLFAPPKPAEDRPWVWYAPIIKGGFSLVLRRAYFEGFLHSGIGLAGVDLGEVRGAPASNAKFTLFYEEMVRRGYSTRPILLGQSRGGLMMLSWAAQHPDKTRAFVGIYPVCNLSTWAMKNLPVTLADYGMEEGQLRARMAEFNPLDRLGGMIAKKVPLFVVHGDSDAAVPFAENTGLLKERYEAGGGPITVKVIKGEGHQGTPSFFECPELIAFVLEHAKKDAP